MGRKGAEDLAKAFIDVLLSNRLVLSGKYSPGNFQETFDPPIIDLYFLRKLEEPVRGLVSRIKHELSTTDSPANLDLAYEDLSGENPLIRLRLHYSPNLNEKYPLKNSTKAYEQATEDCLRRLPKIVKDFQQKNN